MSEFLIRPMQKSDIPLIKTFTDMAIGTGYYSIPELEEIFEKSIAKNGQMTTLVLLIDNKVMGVRITYPPGKWKKGKGKGLSPERWPFPLDKTAYFQSLFIHPDLTGQGFGTKLSLKAIEILRQVGAQGIVCHSWKESPNDSSGKYLRGLGFQFIESHPLYWKEVDYVCTRCGKPCLCTAEELYLSI